MLDAASTPQALNLPRYRLHRLKGDMKAMKSPIHPGRIVRQDCLEPFGLSITAGAKALGVTRQTLNNVVNEKAGISPQMAIRLSKAFGSTAETWLAMQAAFDLAQVRKHESKIRVKRLEAIRPEVAA